MLGDTAPLRVGHPMQPDRIRLGRLMDRIIDNGWYSNSGPLAGELERALRSELPGTGTLNLVSSGTAALMMALRLGNLPEGSEIIVPAVSFIATAQAVTWCGFVPVFADIDPVTMTLCPRAVDHAITPNTSAILGVHLLGLPCDHGALRDIADQHNLWLVYDGAQAIDVRRDGRSVGAWGDATAFSLHATKMLHTGEGGIIATPNPDDKAHLQAMRNFGTQSGAAQQLGTNAKLSEAQAAIGLALLPDLQSEKTARAALRSAYDAVFDNTPMVRVHRAPDGPTGLLYYAIRVAPEHHVAILSALAANGVWGRGAFPLMNAPDSLFGTHPTITAQARPVAPQIAPEVLCLPINGHVSPPQARDIAQIVCQTLQSRR